ncbi:hypothetical protein BGZ80_002362 [Entomortierella chlamydospora]|uniref:Uncharacterized protein n=1 Tax=Entomortierella chlamydospora TaxID=101097 RepID=A0A9P6T3Q3_9FUNG|nr:hypothetical protein BGZ79_000763 [Entomortierella chlamydospora]KAG0021445.1 hypothetical protein BGZ80_002362 [Entomortierella chlamydospora]
MNKSITDSPFDGAEVSAPRPTQDVMEVNTNTALAPPAQPLSQPLPRGSKGDRVRQLNLILASVRDQQMDIAEERLSVVLDQELRMDEETLTPEDKLQLEERLNDIEEVLTSLQSIACPPPILGTGSHPGLLPFVPSPYENNKRQLIKADMPKLKDIAQITSMRRRKKESYCRYADRIQYYTHCYGVQDNNDHVLGSLLKPVEEIQNELISLPLSGGFVGPFGSEDYDEIDDQSASTKLKNKNGSRSKSSKKAKVDRNNRTAGKVRRLVQ